MNDVDDYASIHEEDDDEEEFAAPKRARGAKKSTTAKSTSTKPRKARKAANEPRSKNAHTDDDASETGQQGASGPSGRDFAIDSDNTLFSAHLFIPQGSGQKADDVCLQTRSSVATQLTKPSLTTGSNRTIKIKVKQWQNSSRSSSG